MNSPLFIPLTERQATDDWLGRRLTQALSDIEQSSASPTIDLEGFKNTLAAKTFEEPEPFQALLDWTVQSMQTGAVQMTHPRYFGLFNPSPAYPSECADRISAALNPQICVLSHAPVAVLIEQHVVRQMGRRIGFNENSVGGHFTSGGSEANATSVICALTRAIPEFAEQGCRAFSGQPRLYVSKESHLAWLKIAHTCGMGRRAVRMIATDGSGRMSSEALKAQIKQDVTAGDVPIMIAATAGTTNAGMIDPIEVCADIARQQGIWLHVDAAWGGALVADQTQASVLSGIEQADSVTIDAHKWFATTMGTGMFITPHADVLEASFHAKASYMPSSDAEVDYYLTSLQWSRRSSGLRLFLSLASGGWDAFAQHIRQGLRLIELLNEQMRAAGWRVVNDSKMALTCLLPPDPKQVAEVVDFVVTRGCAWISVAILEERPVVRVCVTNGHTNEDDINLLAAELIKAAAH